MDIFSSFILMWTFTCDVHVKYDEFFVQSFIEKSSKLLHIQLIGLKISLSATNCHSDSVVQKEISFGSLFSSVVLWPFLIYSYGRCIFTITLKNVHENLHFNWKIYGQWYRFQWKFSSKMITLICLYSFDDASNECAHLT